jgi:hypothetical protein
VGRFLIFGHRNPAWPWPDVGETLKLMERGWVVIDHFIKTGLIKEFGLSLDGRSAYGIAEGPSEHVFRIPCFFFPYWEMEVHEILPYQKAKEILTDVIKSA